MSPILFSDTMLSLPHQPHLAHERGGCRRADPKWKQLDRGQRSARRAETNALVDGSGDAAAAGRDAADKGREESEECLGGRSRRGRRFQNSGRSDRPRRAAAKHKEEEEEEGKGVG